MKWLYRLLYGICKDHRFYEKDIYLCSDPECVYCGKKMSELYAEEGKPFVKKSIIQQYEEFFKKYGD